MFKVRGDSESSELDLGPSNSRLCAVPKGLADYITPYDVCAAMPLLRAYVATPSSIKSIKSEIKVENSDMSESQWYNAGLILRWTLGVNSMERYSKIPTEKVLDFTEQWVRGVTGLVGGTGGVGGVGSEYLSLLSVTEGVSEGNMVGDVNTIVSFGVNVAVTAGSGGSDKTNRQLTFDEMKVFHMKMTLAVPVPHSLLSAPPTPPAPPSTSPSSSTSPPTTESNHTLGDIKRILGTRIMLGQPVKLAEPSGSLSCSGTVVRIALGATMVIDACTLMTANTGSDASMSAGISIESSIERMKREDEIVVDKMILLAKYWEEISAPTVKVAVAAVTETANPLSVSTGTK